MTGTFLDSAFNVVDFQRETNLVRTHVERCLGGVDQIHGLDDLLRSGGKIHIEVYNEGDFIVISTTATQAEEI